MRVLCVCACVRHHGQVEAAQRGASRREGADALRDYAALLAAQADVKQLELLAGPRRGQPGDGGVDVAGGATARAEGAEAWQLSDAPPKRFRQRVAEARDVDAGQGWR